MLLLLAIRFVAVGLLEHQNQMWCFGEVLLNVVRLNRAQIRDPLLGHALCVVDELFRFNDLSNAFLDRPIGHQTERPRFCVSSTRSSSGCLDTSFHNFSFNRALTKLAHASSIVHDRVKLIRCFERILVQRDCRSTVWNARFLLQCRRQFIPFFTIAIQICSRMKDTLIRR